MLKGEAFIHRDQPGDNYVFMKCEEKHVSENIQGFTQMRKRIVVFIGLVLILSSWNIAQSSQRMLLRFRAEGTMQALGIYGPAGVTVKAEGFAHLFPGSQGKVTGDGVISVTMDFNYPKTGVVSISQLKGDGPLEVVGQKEGKFLRFYFKPNDIPCKGEIIVNYPAPMGTQKEPYEDHFDPNVLAPGEQPGAKIELKNGAVETFSFGPKSYAGGRQNVSWTTDFTIHNLEQWNVTIEGEEIDSTQPPIKNKKLKTKSKELPVALKYHWKLTGEFFLIGSSGAKEYYDGYVLSSKIYAEIVFDFYDLYRWSEISSEEFWDEEDLINQTINGKVSGNNVQLGWPKFTPKNSFSLAPRLSYLGQARHRKDFKSAEFMGYLSREKLPLVDGQVVMRTQPNWLEYRITLKKLK
jgi:hypothetical protein